jgi:dTMP kinase
MRARTIDREGQFIVFEGIDGVGKTTLAKRLINELRKDGVPCEGASFPGRESGTLAAHIYRLYHRPSRFGVRAIDHSALQLLLTAAHIETIQSRILPSLHAGRTVILDRFWWSTWVYGRASGVSGRFLAGLLEIEDLAWSGFQPNRVFLVTRSHRTRYAGERNQRRRLSALYRSLARREAARGAYSVSILSNDGAIDQTMQKLRAKLDVLGVRRPVVRARS